MSRLVVWLDPSTKLYPKVAKMSSANALGNNPERKGSAGLSLRRILRALYHRPAAPPPPAAVVPGGTADIRKAPWACLAPHDTGPCGPVLASFPGGSSWLPGNTFPETARCPPTSPVTKADNRRVVPSPPAPDGCSAPESCSPTPSPAPRAESKNDRG